MKLDARLTMFISLVATFMVCLVVGDLIGGKLTAFHLFGRDWPFSVGQIAFPVTFILTDILNEFYGKVVVRKVTFLAFCMVGLTLVIIKVADALPFWEVTRQPGWDGVTSHEFTVVFTQAVQIQLASMIAFLIANLVDISVFFAFKRMTGNKYLWLRATGSTAVSQLIDTVVINGIIWGRKMHWDEWRNTAITSYVVKVGIAIAVTPILYALHVLIEKRFGIPPAAPDETNADLE